MPSAAPTVTEVARLTFDVTNASSVATIKVARPGVYVLSTTRGQQVVVGNGVYRADARARMSASGAVEFEQIHVCYRYGDQRNEVDEQTMDAAHAVVRKLIWQVSAEVDAGWRHILEEAAERTLAQYRAELVVAELAAAAHHRNVSRLETQLASLHTRIETARSQVTAADVVVVNLQDKIDTMEAAEAAAQS